MGKESKGKSRPKVNQPDEGERKPPGKRRRGRRGRRFWSNL